MLMDSSMNKNSVPTRNQCIEYLGCFPFARPDQPAHEISEWPCSWVRELWRENVRARLGPLHLTLFRLGGGGGGGKCPRRFQLSRTSLIFKQYLPNVATFTKVYWGTRFWRNFASTVSHVATGTIFSTPCLLKFGLFKYFSPLINEIFKTRANY